MAPAAKDVEGRLTKAEEVYEEILKGAAGKGSLLNRNSQWAEKGMGGLMQVNQAYAPAVYTSAASLNS